MPRNGNDIVHSEPTTWKLLVEKPHSSNPHSRDSKSYHRNPGAGLFDPKRTQETTDVYEEGGATWAIHNTLCFTDKMISRLTDTARQIRSAVSGVHFLQTLPTRQWHRAIRQQTTIQHSHIQHTFKSAPLCQCAANAQKDISVGALCRGAQVACNGCDTIQRGLLSELDGAIGSVAMLAQTEGSWMTRPVLFFNTHTKQIIKTLKKTVKNNDRRKNTMKAMKEKLSSLLAVPTVDTHTVGLIVPLRDTRIAGLIVPLCGTRIASLVCVAMLALNTAGCGFLSRLVPDEPAPPRPSVISQITCSLDSVEGLRGCVDYALTDNDVLDCLLDAGMDIEMCIKQPESED